MSTPRRRRRDREPLSHSVGTPDLVPTAMGGVPNLAETLSREPTEEEIARRAYQLYEARGGEHGRDQEDWFQAERELRQDGRRNLLEKILATQGPYAAA